MTGELALTARLNDTVQPGTVWIPESGNPPVGDLLDGSGAEAVDIARQETAQETVQEAVSQGE